MNKILCAPHGAIEFLLGARHVILGDPGTGESAYSYDLALSGIHDHCNNVIMRNPTIACRFCHLRRYADELKSRKNLSLLDYIQEKTQADFSLEILV